MRWRRPLILLGAFLLRMIRLQVRPLWYDEAFAILYGSISPVRMVYGTVAPVTDAGAADVHPLLYYSLLHGWMKALGQSPFAARFLSVILGLTTVALLWRLATLWFGNRVGIVTGLLAAVNPFHVSYSQEARMYALLALMSTMTAFALLRIVANGSRENARERTASRLLIWWTVYVAGATLTLYSHNLGAFVLLGLHVMVAIRRCWRHHLPPLLVADLAVLGLFGPWLVLVLPGQVEFVGRGYWLSSPGLDEIVRALMLPILTFYEPAPAWLMAIALSVGLLLAVFLALQVMHGHSEVIPLLFLSWMPVLTIFVISFWQPLYLERALLPSALFYLLPVGWLLIRAPLPNVLRHGLVLLLAIGTVGSLGIHYSYAQFPRPPFQEAARYLETHVEAGDAVVHTNKLTYFPMHVYAPQLRGSFLADPRGSPRDTLAHPTQQALGLLATESITNAVGTSRRVWLVYFPREVYQARAVAGRHPALQWMERRFAEVERKRFSDLVVALYRREDG